MAQPLPGGCDAEAVTHGHLLDGRVRYAQPARGFRSGLEPVLLAASVPARAGERVLEGGSGAGAALLCLAARVPGVQGIGIELDAVLCGLASDNAEANGFGNLRFVAADIAALPELGVFDHACANPPYHAADSTPPTDLARRIAKRGGEAVIADWVAGLARPLRAGGTLTLIAPAALMPAAVRLFGIADCPLTAAMPLWPKAGRPAKLVLLRGVKASRAAFRILPGLVLHAAGGGFTQAANSVLRGGEPLAF